MAFDKIIIMIIIIKAHRDLLYFLLNTYQLVRGLSAPVPSRHLEGHSAGQPPVQGTTQVQTLSKIKHVNHIRARYSA
jgi:hypothetical protein